MLWNEHSGRLWPTGSKNSRLALLECFCSSYRAFWPLDDIFFCWVRTRFRNRALLWSTSPSEAWCVQWGSWRHRFVSIALCRCTRVHIVRDPNRRGGSGKAQYKLKQYVTKTMRAITEGRRTIKQVHKRDLPRWLLEVTLNFCTLVGQPGTLEIFATQHSLLEQMHVQKVLAVNLR